MQCPYCHHADGRVVDTRELATGVRRRRECAACHRRYTTYERVESGPLAVVKKDGRREPFDRRKLERGLRTACAKRPVAADAITRLADEVEAAILKRGEAEVPSRLIGELVMDRLRDLDPIAYIRFASVYRSFADLEAMRAFMEGLDAGRGK